MLGRQGASLVVRKVEGLASSREGALPLPGVMGRRRPGLVTRQADEWLKLRTPKATILSPRIVAAVLVGGNSAQLPKTGRVDGAAGVMAAGDERPTRTRARREGACASREPPASLQRMHACVRSLTE